MLMVLRDSGDLIFSVRKGLTQSLIEMSFAEIRSDR